MRIDKWQKRERKRDKEEGYKHKIHKENKPKSDKRRRRKQEWR